MAASAETKSGGWVYPLKGIHYVATHRFLWPLFKGRLLPCFILSIFVLGNLFVWTYLPQVAFLAIWQGKSSWLNATVLVLGEVSAITALLFEAFLADHVQVDIFDAVLINEGFSNLVAKGRHLDTDEDNPVKCLGKHHRSATYAPFSLRQIVEFILLLPLDFVPFIGFPLFLWLTGYRAGPFQHWRYFKLKDFTKSERKEFIREKRLDYTGLGTMHLFLQLLPPLSMIFLLTTAAGAALWASDMEQMRIGTEEDGAEEQQPLTSDPPPEYSVHPDDPI